MSVFVFFVVFIIPFNIGFSIQRLFFRLFQYLYFGEIPDNIELQNRNVRTRPFIRVRISKSLFDFGSELVQVGSHFAKKVGIQYDQVVSVLFPHEMPLFDIGEPDRSVLIQFVSEISIIYEVVIIQLPFAHFSIYIDISQLYSL